MYVRGESRLLRARIALDYSCLCKLVLIDDDDLMVMGRSGECRQTHQVVKVEKV